MPVAISGIGTANPQYTQTQSNVLTLMTKALQLSKVEQRLLKTIVREAGVERRYSVLEDFIKTEEMLTFFPNAYHDEYPSTHQRMKLYQQHALPLALVAIEQCLAQAAINKNAITHLITVSCTGMYAPGLDIEILQQAAMPSTVERATINFMGCYGVFNALKMARSICTADEHAKVLIVSVELCTIHFQKSLSLDNLISSSIFSDGAGALLVETAPQTDKYFILSDFYCDIVPDSEREMTWDIGDYGFDIRLSSYVPQLIEQGIGQFIDRLLSRKSAHGENFDYYAIHPGSKRILEACEQALKIKPEDNRFSYEVLRQFGNMSSATITFVLKKLFANLNQADHAKKVLSCAFGPGLTLESMILTLNHV